MPFRDTVLGLLGIKKNPFPAGMSAEDRIRRRNANARITGGTTGAESAYLNRSDRPGGTTPEQREQVIKDVRAKNRRRGVRTPGTRY